MDQTVTLYDKDGKAWDFPADKKDAAIASGHFVEQAAQASEHRGLLSATKEMIQGTPSALGGLALDVATGFAPQVPYLYNRRVAQGRENAANFADKVKRVGVPAAVVRYAGEQVGIPSEAIAKDYEEGNYQALAGDVAAPFVVAGLTGAVAKGAGVASEAISKATKTQHVIAQDAYLARAVDLGKIAPSEAKSIRQTALPFLEQEHGASPIVDTPSLVKAAESATKRIETQIAPHVAEHADQQIFNPSSRIRKTLSGSEVKDFGNDGVKYINDRYDLKNMTLADADAIRRQVNADMDSMLTTDKLSRDQARATNPKFAAMEELANNLKDQVYDTLENNGVVGVRELRQCEGAVLKVRNAAFDTINLGDRELPSNISPKQKAVGDVFRAASGAASGIGGYAVSHNPIVATGVGAAGQLAGNAIADIIAPRQLTRDAMIAKAFQHPTTNPPVGITTISTVPLNPARAELSPAIRKGLPEYSSATMTDVLPVDVVEGYANPANPLRALLPEVAGVPKSSFTSQTKAPFTVETIGKMKPQGMIYMEAAEKGAKDKGIQVLLRDGNKVVFDTKANADAFRKILKGNE